MKNKKKKIAFFLPSLHIGGIERVFITYANYLVGEYNDVDFVLCRKEGKLLSLLSPNVRLYNLGNVQLRYSLLKLRQYLNTVHPDIIISGGDFPNLILILSSLKLKRSPKIIISQHNYYNIETKRLGWWARSTCYMMRILYPKADRVIAVSNGIYDFLVNKIHISKNKIIKLPNPIDIKEIKEKSLEVYSKKLPDKYILFVGRLTYIKNLSFLLDAFEETELDNYYLVIVGDGEMKDILIEKTKRMQKANRIIFLGAIENPLPILRNSKLLVLPSLSEAYPTILLEALCLYVPILSTPTKGAKEILNNIPGTYISNDFYNVKEFATFIEKCINTKVDPRFVQKKINLNLIENVGFRIQHEIIDNR